MKFVADFHIHSHFSIATSKNLTPENLDYWAGLKGIQLVGTGDFTHPGWFKELKEKLEPAQGGLFRLKSAHKLQSGNDQPQVRFILTSEISSIYKLHGRVRKVHNLIFVPDFESVDQIRRRLSKVGNLGSDGRPILGLDSRDLLEIILEVSDGSLLVPAHIWTPWFSMLGSKSGFDSVKECFGDLSGHIYALETGLSSDPAMNRLCSFLDQYALISNSDAHSPEKLGREANLFDCELSYDTIIDAIKRNDADRFTGTLEFYPEEGKYHFDGHRKCLTCWHPRESRTHKYICPVCGTAVTRGVLNRILELADRDPYADLNTDRPFQHLVSLKEILSEIMEIGVSSKKLHENYLNLIRTFGTELNILLHLPLSDLENDCCDKLVEAIRRVRTGKVKIRAGYDGIFGNVSIF